MKFALKIKSLDFQT